MCYRWLSRRRHGLDGTRPQHLSSRVIGDRGRHPDERVDGMKAKGSGIIQEVDRYSFQHARERTAKRVGSPLRQPGELVDGFQATR